MNKIKRTSKHLVEGQKVWFEGEKQAYKVVIADNRYAICTKPFNPARTVLYTIVDTYEGIRGTNDFIFNPYDYREPGGCLKCLMDLQLGKTGISHRNRVELKITKTKL